MCGACDITEEKGIHNPPSLDGSLIWRQLYFRNHTSLLWTLLCNGLDWEYCYNLIQQPSHSLSATPLRKDAVVLLRSWDKRHAKLKKNSANLKCKHLQIFLTAVHKLLCPHRQIEGWNVRTIGIPSKTVVGLKAAGNVFIVLFSLFFFSIFFLFLKTESGAAETVPTPPTFFCGDTWIHTRGWNQMRSLPSEAPFFPKSLCSFSPVTQEVNKPSHKRHRHTHTSRLHAWNKMHLSSYHQLSARVKSLDPSRKMPQCKCTSNIMLESKTRQR